MFFFGFFGPDVNRVSPCEDEMDSKCTANLVLLKNGISVKATFLLKLSWIDNIFIQLKKIGLFISTYECQITNLYWLKIYFNMTFFGKENDDMEKQANRMCDLAVDNFQNKNFDEAKKLLQKAIELYPSHAMSWHNLGVLFKVMGNFNEALECYNKAIQYSSNPDFAYSRGVLLLQPNFCKNTGTASDPIKITGARDHLEGIQMEYLYLKLHYGIPNDDWYKISQKLGENGGKLCDVITIKFKDGVQKSIFFDISEFYGHIK